jgi:HAD superfamily hydrolase (TIGR01509 family)
MSVALDAQRSRGIWRLTEVKTQPVESPLPDLIIYDCDGTLIDSERLVAKVCMREIHALGLTHWTMDRYFGAFVGMPGHVGWAEVVRELGRPLPHGLNDRVDDRILELMRTELQALPGARAAIEAIGGHRCVASSTAQPHLSDNIRFAGLGDLFGDNVYSAKQVRRAKPAPDVFLFAASQMGHDPKDCIVIEDSVPGVLAARRAGMAVIGFTGAAHDASLMDNRLREAGVLSVARHMDDLPALVRAL